MGEVALLDLLDLAMWTDVVVIGIWIFATKRLENAWWDVCTLFLTFVWIWENVKKFFLEAPFFTSDTFSSILRNFEYCMHLKNACSKWNIILEKAKILIFPQVKNHCLVDNIFLFPSPAKVYPAFLRYKSVMSFCFSIYDQLLQVRLG